MVGCGSTLPHFLSRGTSGQWRDLLDNADLARYATRERTLASDELIDWVHREAITEIPFRGFPELPKPTVSPLGP